MKKFLFILVIAGVVSSCEKEDNSNTELIGNWKLAETLLDPGGGGGTFSPVVSDKVISFMSDGTISSNGNLCDMSIDIGNMTSGFYSETTASFSSNDCNDPNYNYTFEHNGNILIINYPCIEPCQAKYIKE